jgi:phage gp36-like protein
MYCLPSDVREAVGGTDAGTGTCAQLDDGALNAAIAQASTKVSSYCGTSWVVDANNPVVTVPDLVTQLTIALAVFYATLTYRKGKDLAAFDPIYLRYQDATRTLADIASGLIEVAPTAPLDPVDKPGQVFQTVPKTFDHADSGTRIGLDGRVEADTGWRSLTAGWY